MDLLAEMPEQSVQTCITSPPYWGLRDYGTATWKGGDLECDHIQQSVGMSGSNTLGPDKHLPETNAANVGRKLQYKSSCGKCGAIRIDDQLGLEPTPEQYVKNMVEVFRAVRRVLRDDGTLWLNLGDSYAGYWGDKTAKKKGERSTADTNGWTNGFHMNAKPSFHEAFNGNGIKPKDLVGIPWRVAFALQADGWYLRSDIIWHKPNPMPESVTDRPTKAHEYIFLLTKQPRYYYDADAIREAPALSTISRLTYNGTSAKVDSSRNDAQPDMAKAPHDSGRNRRSVWTVTTKPFSGAHFAVFPPDLIEPCVLAGSSPTACGECGAPYERIVERTTKPKGRSDKSVYTGKAYSHPQSVVSGPKKNLGGSLPAPQTVGWQPSCDHSDDTGKSVVLDPFSGSGTTGMVALRHDRSYIGLELNPEYAAMSRERIRNDAPLLNTGLEVAA